MVLYVNFHFTKKFVFTTENGNVKKICNPIFRDVASYTIVIC